MAGSITAAEQTQVDAANASGKRAVVLVHGLWLLANSWDLWRPAVEAAGYAPVAIDWPDDPPTVAEGKAHPEVFANKSVGQIADHVDDVISALHTKPAVVGHSFGGLLTQIVAGRGIAAASVPIDPAPGRGILPLPFSALKVASVALKNPANRGKGVGLTFEQFVYGFGNAIPEDEARRLYDAYSVPGPAKVLFQAAAANMNPASETKTDTKNPERGAMLVISGGKDHTVPPSVAKAAYKRQRKNSGVTEFHQFDDRGHSLAMDHGWQEVADTALAFVTEHAPPT